MADNTSGDKPMAADEQLEEWKGKLEYASRKLSKGYQFPGAQAEVRSVLRQIEAELTGEEVCQSCEGSGSAPHPDEICSSCDGTGWV